MKEALGIQPNEFSNFLAEFHTRNYKVPYRVGRRSTVSLHHQTSSQATMKHKTSPELVWPCRDLNTPPPAKRQRAPRVVHEIQFTIHTGRALPLTTGSIDLVGGSQAQYLTTAHIVDIPWVTAATVFADPGRHASATSAICKQVTAAHLAYRSAMYHCSAKPGHLFVCCFRSRKTWTLLREPLHSSAL